MAKKQMQEMEQIKSGIENLSEKLETLRTTVPKDKDLKQVKTGIKNLSEQLEVLKTTVPKDEEKKKDDFAEIKSGIEKLSQKFDTLWTSLPNVEDPLTNRQPSATDKKELRDSSCLEECQKQLRSIYETSNKVKIVPWDQSSSLHIDKVYTQLSWLRDENSPSGMTQEEIEHYTDIFDGRRLHRTPKRILVHGRPGIGKTVFTQKATFDWSQHRFKGKLERFDLVLLVKLRDVCDLQDVPAILRASKLVASDGLVSIDDLYDYVRRHQEKVLLILDGYDEYAYGAENQSPVREIWEKKQLWDCCVVITSRDMKGEGLKKGSDAQFQIDGFDRDRQEEFARRFLKGDQDVEEFFEYLNQQELEDVAKIPLLLLMLCLAWKEKDRGGLPSSRAMVYFQFIQTLFNHMASKDLEEGDAVTFTDVKDYKEELCEIGELAFYALLQDSLYFPANELPNHILTTKLIKAGLFQLLNMSALNPCKAVHFIHKSLQEYLASFFLTEELSSQKDKNNSLFKVDSVEKIVKMTEVFKFAVEMSEEAAREIVVHLTGMAAKKDGLTEYSFDNESLTVRDLSEKQGNYLDLCTKSLFCCSASTRKELLPSFLSSLGGVLVINPKQLIVTVTENLLKTAAPLMYIFFSYSGNEQHYRHLITLTQQLNAVIVSCSGEMKASEFLKKYPWRSSREFFLKRELFKTHLYFSEIVKSEQNGSPFQMINALVSLDEATNKTKINPGGESSEQACSTHALSRVWVIDAWSVNRSEVELLLSDVFPFVLAPQMIRIVGEDDAEFDSDMAKKILSAINRTNKLQALTLCRLNVRSNAASFIATIFEESPNLEVLDLSENPLLGEGVDAISKHLRSTPHLWRLWLYEVNMTKEQVQQLTEEAMKLSSITELVTDYHDLDGNPIPENESEPLEKDRWYLRPLRDSSSESGNEEEQIQKELEQLSTNSSSLNTHPSSRDAPFTVQFLTSSGDEESPRKTEKGKKREAHWVTEGDQGSSRKRKKREKHKAHRATEGDEGSRRKRKEKRKHKAHRMTEGDEGSSPKTKKREKHKAHRVTEGDEESPLQTKERKQHETRRMTEGDQGTTRKRKKRKKHKAHRVTEGDEESPLKTKERKKRETRRMTEGDEGSSRKRKKREKHKAHRVTEGDEESPRKRKKNKKHRAHRRAEGDEGSSPKRKKREKHKAHRVTDGDEESPLKTKERKQHETRRMTEGAVKEGNPTRYELEGLSLKVPDKWKELGRRLGFDDEKLLDFDQKKKLSDKAYDMLIAWKQANGSDATYLVLNKALRHEYVELRDLAEKFCCH